MNERFTLDGGYVGERRAVRLRSVSRGSRVSNLLVTSHRHTGVDLWQKGRDVDELPDPLGSGTRQQVILLLVVLLWVQRRGTTSWLQHAGGC